jgi:hypothetical protein
VPGSTTNAAFSEYIYFDGRVAAGGEPFRYELPLTIFFGCRTLRILKGADFDSRF